MSNETTKPDFISKLPETDAKRVNEIQNMISPEQLSAFNEACEYMHELAQKCIDNNSNTNFLASLMSRSERSASQSLKASLVENDKVIARELVDIYERYGKSAEAQATMPEAINVGTNSNNRSTAV